MYVRHLKIEDLRAIRSAEIDLLYPGRHQDEAYEDVTRWPPRLDNVNVFLGNNGSGKSTLLSAIALSLISPIASSSGYRPRSLIRRPRTGKVNGAEISTDLLLHAQDGGRDGDQATFKAHVLRRGDIEFLQPSSDIVYEPFFEDDNSAFFFVGYGASRRTEALSANDLATRRRQRAVRYERVASLFEDHYALTPLSSWLPGWRSENPGRYRQVVNLLNKLLPPSISFTEELEAGEYLFGYRSLKLPYSALSDGYRIYIGWIGDLLYHLCMGAPSGFKLVQSRGVVMVDEVDLHIHPAWQRTLIPTLARVLSNIQFVFTTHSPLVVSTLERSNIYNVQLGRGPAPEIRRPDEETFGLSADQLLRSEVFGLDSSRDPEFADKLRDLSQAAERGEEGAALAYLRGASAGGAENPPDAGGAPEWLKDFAGRSKS
ncbi:ATP-binding protein (plasmid) [Rhizobium ruizarguesonis]|uniref:AAA family ATPase n=1 Tax=Rhizobium ruizarguesonis TaxID=2081791 RepID=UPI00102FE8C3|nr:AAA family ATPase [Rhizobium ruizarguesonis]TBC25609.1 ATP-binding protein [Rhizobium ruizarguesonis]